MEYIAFGEVLFEEHSSSFSSPHLFNGKELDRETNMTYYGARYLDMETSLWLNVDPLTEKMLNYGAYAFCFNNPINIIDPDGREGVPVSMIPNSFGPPTMLYPKLKNSQWHTVGGLADPATFHKAAIYNLKYNNVGAYTNIGERHGFYGWADKQISNKSKWCATAEIVTRTNAVGAADGINLWWLSDGVDKFLQQGNKLLFSYNMNNFKNIQNGTLNNSFTDANGSNVSFKGLSGKS